MREVKGNWKDLLSAYSLAFDAKKIYMGLMAVVWTVVVMTITCFLYFWANGPDPGLRELGSVYSMSFLPQWILAGKGLQMLGQFAPMLNPFHANLLHFILSIFFYCLLIVATCRYLAPITRLAALEYARDDIPSLEEARELAHKKHRAYMFVPIAPLLAVLAFTICLVIAGLIGQIPVVGGWLMTLLYIFIIPTAIVLLFIVVFGVLSFGLMFPAISVDGRDAFDGWSRAYSYVLWGVNRFVCYVALAGALGLIAVSVACFLGEGLIYTTVNTVEAGLGRKARWLDYAPQEYEDTEGVMQMVGVTETETVSTAYVAEQLAKSEQRGEKQISAKMMKEELQARIIASEPETWLRRHYDVIVYDNAADRAYYYRHQYGNWKSVKIGEAAPMVDGPIIAMESTGKKSLGLTVSAVVGRVIFLGIRGGVVGYAVAYFFTAFTLIYFLMRKHVDRVDITDIYVEGEEEGETPFGEPLPSEEPPTAVETPPPGVTAPSAAEEEEEEAEEEEPEVEEEEEEEEKAEAKPAAKKKASKKKTTRSKTKRKSRAKSKSKSKSKSKRSRSKSKRKSSSKRSRSRGGSKKKSS